MKLNRRLSFIFLFYKKDPHWKSLTADIYQLLMFLMSVWVAIGYLATTHFDY